MIRGLYTATTGMMTQEKKLDIVMNNLSNASTVGFKQDALVSRSFADMMVERSGDSSIVQASREVGPLNNGIHVDQVYTNFTSGSLSETGSSTDLALTGDDFFVIGTSQGDRYTQSGSFTLDAEGYLATAEGDRVQGQNGAIRIGTADFAVDSQGWISAGGQTIDQLRRVGFTDTTGLRKEGGNLYSSSGGQAAQAPDGQVRQGYLETANVDLADQMVSLIEIQRSYEINQRVIQIMDDKLGRSVNDIGRV